MSELDTTETIDIESSPFNYLDYLDKITRFEVDTLLLNVYITPTGIIGHLKFDDFDMPEYKELLLNNDCIEVVGGFEDDIGIILNKNKPTANQFKLIEKIINYYKPTEVDLYLMNSNYPKMELKGDECTAQTVSNEIDVLYDVNEELELDATEPVRLQKLSDSNYHNYFNKELSRMSYYLSSAGIDVLKEWAGNHDVDLYRHIDENPDDRRVIISKIKPSYKSKIHPDRYYYNIFGHDWYNEIEWWGQIPKSLGDELIKINENLIEDLDLEVAEHAKYSIYRHNRNFVEYTYLGEDAEKFKDELLDSGDLIFSNPQREEFKEYCVNANKVQLLIRGYKDDNLISVGIGLYLDNFPYRWFEHVVHHKELLNIVSILGIELPDDDSTIIKTERF